MAVEITQNLTQVTISTAGVQGLKGETGATGASADSSALVTTSSFNQFTSSIQSDVNSIKAWTASLELINTIDTELLQFYQTTSSLNTQTGSQNSINLGISTATGSLIGITNGLMAFTAALDSTYASDVQLLPILQVTRSIELHSGSMVGITNGLMAYTSSNESWKDGIRGEISAIEAWTSSLELINTIDTELLQLYQTTASLNSKTGSYATTGSNTFNGNQTINGYITLQNGAVIKDTSNNGVSFGYLAGDINQGTQSLALGNGAGYQNQSHGTVAIGTNAGAVNQGLRATALGSLAGTYNQGEYAVAIGNYAAPNNQASHSIVISALGTALENTISNSLVIAPIRNISGGDGVLQYNNTTKEVSYSNSISSSILISGSIVPSVAEGSYTSSFSLGSSTNAWKDIWVSEGSINFVNSLTGVTSSISLNTTTNEIVVSNLSINTASLDSRIVAIETAALSASFFTSSIQFTSSFDERYTQTSSLNTFTGSFNAISSSFATTGSNQFSGSQYITSGGLVFNNGVQLYEDDSDLYIQSLSEIRVRANGNNYKFGNDGNFYTSVGGVVFSGDGLINQIPGASGDNINIVAGVNDGIVLTTDAGDGDYVWDFDKNGDLTVPGNIYGATNLATNGGNIFNGNQIIAGTLLVSGSTDFDGGISITGSINISGSITFAPSSTSDEVTASIAEYRNGISLIAETTDTDGYAQLYWNGLPGTGNTFDGSDLYSWAYASGLGFQIQYKDVANSKNFQWHFDTNGDLSVARNIKGVLNLATTGSNTFSGNQTITGSLDVSGDIIGSLLATNGVISSSAQITIQPSIYNGAATEIISANGGYLELKTNDGNNSVSIGDSFVTIYSNSNFWRFNTDGEFVLPNGTVQTTAFNKDNVISFGFATTGSNTFSGNQTITGSLMISGSGSLNGDNIVASNTIMKIETISSASYAALNPPVSGTLYIII